LEHHHWRDARALVNDWRRRKRFKRRSRSGVKTKRQLGGQTLGGDKKQVPNDWTKKRKKPREKKKTLGRTQGRTRVRQDRAREFGEAMADSEQKRAQNTPST